MLKSQRSRKTRDRGFTILEVLIASVVLVVGVVGVASLVPILMTTEGQSKYMSLAATLASEKLEDLNHWDVQAPQVCVPSGNSSVGSLTADVLQTTTCSTGASASIAYYDNVTIGFANDSAACPSSTGGCFAETVSSESGGTTTYVTTYHSPDGLITTSSSNAAPTNATFHRRWIIEGNEPVTGVRRVTVEVTQLGAIQHAVTFQMSLVRP